MRLFVRFALGAFAALPVPALADQPALQDGYYREAWRIRPQQVDEAPQVVGQEKPITEAVLDPLKLIVTDSDYKNLAGEVIVPKGTQLALMYSNFDVACTMKWNRYHLQEGGGNQILCFIDTDKSGNFSKFFDREFSRNAQNGVEIPKDLIDMQPGAYHIEDATKTIDPPKVVVTFYRSVFDVSGSPILQICIEQTALCVKKTVDVDKKYYPAKLGIYGGILEISYSADNKTQFQLKKPFEAQEIFVNR